MLEGGRFSGPEFSVGRGGDMGGRERERERERERARPQKYQAFTLALRSFHHQSKHEKMACSASVDVAFDIANKSD